MTKNKRKWIRILTFTMPLIQAWLEKFPEKNTDSYLNTPRI